MATISARFAVSKLISYPDVFHQTKHHALSDKWDAICIFDGDAGIFVPLTSEQDAGFVRHAGRALHSASVRFNKTFDSAGVRLPAGNLPHGLYQARICCKTEQEAMTNAFDHFCADWNAGTIAQWPDCTMPLCKYDPEQKESE